MKHLLNLFLGSAILAGSAGAANMIVNPGFEDDVIASPDTSTPLSSPWVLTGADLVKLSGDLGIAAHGGAQQMQLQNDFSQLSQTVTVTASGSYELSMWVANRDHSRHHMPDASDGMGTGWVPVQLELLAGTYLPADTIAENFSGTIVAADSSNTPDLDSPRGEYVQWTRTYDALAPGDYTVWITNGRREDAGQSQSEQGMFDDVSFDVVPEPSSAVLLGLGGLGLLVRRRK